MMTECKYCKKTFNHSGHLTRHIRTHTREKPYECSYCKKRFSDSSTLTVHTRIHTGERPFCCKFCKKTFSRSDSLRVHVRTHTGEKKFECCHCRKTFSRSGNLTVHMRTHSTVPSGDTCNSIHNSGMECSGCNKSFNQSQDLNCHLKAQHHHHRDADKSLFPTLCKTETVDVYSKPSCCSTSYQQHPYQSSSGSLCCKRVSSGNLSMNYEQCSSGSKLNGYLGNQSTDKSCGITANQSMDVKQELPVSVANHHSNLHCNIPTSSEHYTQLLLQNENKTFDCNNFDKSLARTCQLQRHFQRSLEGIDTFVSTSSACDNQNVVYMNTGLHGHTTEKAAQCGLCEKSVIHMCHLNGDNYYIPFSNSYNSLTNVTNIPAVSMCSTSDINRNQSCTYINHPPLSSQQTFDCERCKNSSLTNGLTESKSPSLNSQIYIKPDVTSNSSNDHVHSSCALISGKTHNGELKYGCENCKTSNHIKDEKTSPGMTSTFNGQNENLKKSQNISLNSTKNQSCSYSGNNKLHTKDQMYECKQCDVSCKDGRGFSHQADTKPCLPLSVNYNNQHELDVKPNLSICPPLEPNIQPNSYYNTIRNHTTDKQFGYMKSFAPNTLDIKTDPTGSNSFFGFLQSLPDTNLFECDNNGDQSFMQFNGFHSTQNSSQKSCLLSSRTSNNSEIVDIKPNLSSIHDQYHQALTHFGQGDTFAKSDFSSCSNTNQSSLESSFYDPAGATSVGITNSGTGVSAGSGMCMKPEPFFCPSSETQSQLFSYHTFDQVDIKPDLSLLWF